MLKKFREGKGISYAPVVKDLGFKMVGGQIHWCLNSNPDNKSQKKVPETQPESFRFKAPERIVLKIEDSPEISPVKASKKMRVVEEERPLDAVEDAKLAGKITSEGAPAFKYDRSVNHPEVRETRHHDKPFQDLLKELIAEKFEFEKLDLFRTAFLACEHDERGLCDIVPYVKKLSDLETAVGIERFRQVMGRLLSKKNSQKVSFIKVKHFLEDVESALTVNN